MLFCVDWRSSSIWMLCGWKLGFKYRIKWNKMEYNKLQITRHELRHYKTWRTSLLEFSFNLYFLFKITLKWTVQHQKHLPIQHNPSQPHINTERRTTTSTVDVMALKGANIARKFLREVGPPLPLIHGVWFAWSITASLTERKYQFKTHRNFQAGIMHCTYMKKIHLQFPEGMWTRWAFDATEPLQKLVNFLDNGRVHIRINENTLIPSPRQRETLARFPNRSGDVVQANSDELDLRHYQEGTLVRWLRCEILPCFRQ